MCYQNSVQHLTCHNVAHFLSLILDNVLLIKINYSLKEILCTFEKIWADLWILKNLHILVCQEPARVSDILCCINFVPCKYPDLYLCISHELNSLSYITKYIRTWSCNLSSIAVAPISSSSLSHLSSTSDIASSLFSRLFFAA